jgi:hypothetical protein
VLRESPSRAWLFPCRCNTRISDAASGQPSGCPNRGDQVYLVGQNDSGASGVIIRRADPTVSGRDHHRCAPQHRKCRSHPRAHGYRHDHRDGRWIASRFSAKGLSKLVERIERTPIEWVAVTSGATSRHCIQPAEVMRRTPGWSLRRSPLGLRSGLRHRIRPLWVLSIFRTVSVCSAAVLTRRNCRVEQRVHLGKISHRLRWFRVDAGEVRSFDQRPGVIELRTAQPTSIARRDDHPGRDTVIPLG